MKKIIIGILFLLIPMCANAEIDPNYDVEGYFAKINIQENGSVKVKEAIVLHGDFNGYLRILNKSNSVLTSSDEFDFEHDARYNPKNIVLNKVAAFKVKDLNRNIVDDVTEESIESSYIKNGAKDEYSVEENANSLEIKSYYACSDCQTAFYFEYTLEDVVVLHNDIAELYYQLFTASDVTEDMNKIDVEVNYPKEDKDALMWGHGNVYGNVKRKNDKTWLVQSDDFDAGSNLDIRTVFSKSLITNYYLTNSNEDALEKIKEIEKQRAEEREKEIAAILAKIKFYNYASAIYIFFLIIIIIYVFIKHDKEHKVDFNAKYYREFIEDYDVEIVNYLMNKKNITPNAMSASIMNLIYKKKIKAEPIETSKKDYTFTLISTDNLSESESYLVDFLFKTVGSDNVFTTKQLKSYASHKTTCVKYNNSYTKWENIVQSIGEKQEFYVNNQKIKILALIYLGIGVILWALQINIEGFLFGKFIIALVVLCFIYITSFTKKTEKGALHYRKWKAFRNFLKDFGKFDTKELPEITLWERYLVYAVVFNLADKVQKSMNVKIQENNYDPMYTPYINSYWYGYSNMFENLNNSFANAHSLAVSTMAAQYSSNSSGTGGGFSSGGGFGGGGGGGHGF